MTEEVLLLDDDLTTLTFLDSVLSGAGFKCSSSGDPQQALATVAAREEILVVVSDLYMPHMSGLEFAEALSALALNRPPPRVLFLTGRPSLETAVGALRTGAYDFLVKPVRPEEIIETVSRALERARQDRRAFIPNVVQLIRQAEQLTGELRRLAEPAVRNTGGSNRQPDPTRDSVHNATSVPSGLRTKVSVLDTIEQLRRVRNRYNSHKLDEVAWELLLELLRAEQSNQKLSVSALTISIPGVSTTTSLRRIGELATGGYVDRTPDARDGRRDFVTLTAKSRSLLTDYLANVDRCLADLDSNGSAAARSGD